MDEQDQEPEVRQEATQVVEKSDDEATSQQAVAADIKNEIKLMRDHFDLMSKKLNQKPVAEDEYRDPVESLQQELSAQRIALEEARVMAKYNDYQDVITKYLPQALKENPSLARELSPTSFETAYQVAKSSKAYLKDKAFSPKTPEAKKIVDNTEKIGSVSGIGTATAGSSEPNFLNMSDEEFRSYKRSRGIY